MSGLVIRGCGCPVTAPGPVERAVLLYIGSRLTRPQRRGRASPGLSARLVTARTTGEQSGEWRCGPDARGMIADPSSGPAKRFRLNRPCRCLPEMPSGGGLSCILIYRPVCRSRCGCQGCEVMLGFAGWPLGWAELGCVESLSGAVRYLLMGEHHSFSGLINPRVWDRSFFFCGIL